VYDDNSRLDETLKKTDSILDRIWKTSAAYAASQPGNFGAGIYIQSLNETIYLHAKRITISIYQDIPEAIWIALYALGAISMFITGFYSGISGGKMGLPGILLGLTFTIMISTISDLDRAKEGMFRISNKPFLELKAKIDSEVN
jgi:hypothetical protein